jgi:DNA-binding NarL/FixJ family response regulator
MGAVRIVVVEDHPLFRRGLIAVLESAGMAVVATATGVSEAVETVRTHLPDVVLMDHQLEDGRGLDAVRLVLGAVPEARIVMLSESRDPADMLDAVRAGAVGYLTKDQRPDRLAEAVGGVVRGEAAVSRVMAAHLIESVHDRDQHLPALNVHRERERLTPRQLEILRLIAAGMTTGEIAGSLYLSPETVRWHVKAILRKLKARTRAEAAAALRELVAS